jgi:hypothetical protein
MHTPRYERTPRAWGAEHERTFMLASAVHLKPAPATVGEPVPSDRTEQPLGGAPQSGLAARRCSSSVS